MLLTLDVGNTQIFGGVYDGDDLKATFRRTSSIRASSDEYGTFFRATLRENGVDPEEIDMAGICSVVPDAVHSLRNCFRKYFRFEAYLLQPGVKTGLKIRYRNALEVGADKIANAIGALSRFPGRNLLIVDFGTATTLCAVTKDKEYLGGVITPGINISMEALESQTARLPTVEIIRPNEVLGRSTVESIQSGLYHGTRATVRFLTAAVTKEHFAQEQPVIVGTGGFGRLFEGEDLYDVFVPELSLLGLRRAVELFAIVTWLLAALIALVPLIISPGSLFYFDVTPKLIALLIGTAIAVPFLFPWVRAKGLSRWLYILAAAQALSVTLSTVFSQRMALSIAGSNWRTLGLLSQSVLLLFTLVTFAWIAGRPERMTLLLRWISAAGSLAALYGIAQYFGWDPWLPAKAYQAGEGIFTIVRPPGTMGHADYFANYLLFVMFAGYALAVNDRAARWLGGCAALLAGFAMVLTGTRGALAGAAAGVVYLLVRLRPRMSWRLLAGCVALVLAGAAFYFSPLGSKLRSRVHWIGEDVRGGGRLLLWRDSIRLASRYWVVGAGPETFSALFPQYQSPELARAYPDFYYESPHNVFLDALTSQGVLGVAILAAWIGLGLWAGNARAGCAPYLAAALIAGVAGHFFTVFILPTAMYFYLTVAMLVGLRSEPVAARRRWALAPLSAGMIFLALRMLSADRSLEVTRRDLDAGRTMDAIEQYRVARRRGLSADLWFARSLGLLATQEAMDAALRATAGEDAQNAYYTVAWLYSRSGDVTRTEQSLRASIACSPNWFKPHWMLAQILRREGRTEEARVEAERAAYLNAGVKVL